MFAAIKSIDGYIYGTSPESRERIEDAARELLAALEQAEIFRRKYDARTDEEKDAARRVLAKAEADPAFQRFLGGLDLTRPGGA